MKKQSSEEKKGCFFSLIFSNFIVVMLCITISVFYVAPKMDYTIKPILESSLPALEATVIQVTKGNRYSIGSIGLSLGIQKKIAEIGANPEDFRAIISVALNKGIKPEELLGLATTETSVCQNIGGGIAYEEAQKRIDKAIEDGMPPHIINWWRTQLTALEQIASELNIDVSSIPGSVGAGAISCFQLMPSNWVDLGSGDFTDTVTAAMRGADFVLNHGYEAHGFESAVKAYNSGAGQSYIDNVMSNVDYWENFTEYTETYTVDTPSGSTIVLFMENLAWYVEGNEDLPPYLDPETEVEEPEFSPPIVDGFAHPYPGSSLCGNSHKLAIGDYIHYGQDFCILPGYEKGPVFAVTACTITLARNIDRRTMEALKWSSSGNTVVCSYVAKDGSKYELIYGHILEMNVEAGNQIDTGGFIGNTGCSWDKDKEYCTAHHMHFGVIKDGVWINPVEYLKDIGIM